MRLWWWWCLFFFVVFGEEEVCVEVLILGAPKAGTTALFAALSDGEAAKELYFFNDDEAFAKGPTHYRRLLGCDHKRGLYVDATPLYLVDAVALSRAFGMAPRAVWIVNVREPVDRAYSHYNMLQRFETAEWRRRGFKGNSSSFEETIAEEINCYEKRSGDSVLSIFEACVATPLGGSLRDLFVARKLKYFGARNGLLSVGLMAPQIQRAQNIIRRGGLLVVSQRALYDDGENVVNAVLTFLGKTEPERRPVKRYESLSDHAAFDLHADAGKFQGHRKRINVRVFLFYESSFFISGFDARSTRRAPRSPEPTPRPNPPLALRHNTIHRLRTT